ncbi:hypothetical protein H6S82_24960 [Planktothrix sp. FACHB-1355]|uniref:Uncharacterized protein n=1 Tax=Aerosakkonema funiforme FACHB-1375 TaxID=2949571 RepID=A0A926ZID6_9CYAN|nr:MULTISPECIES: hypothetical protein [Oscillatoriales]MBD2183142.1 hypothetical protein [Aerosakkonema funiforme FACHB-1375]MBD3562070.1 hypothetical protein [Planktothrix sp. FACHB-1355]
MLHLAQVQKQGLSGEPKLRLIARQESAYTWALISEIDEISATETDCSNDGSLVLVDISPTRQILSVQSAKDWVLDLVKNYLSSGITPAFLRQEKERVEEGLQSLTIEKQDLARRSVELEARREEIQQLEIKLQKQIQVLEAEKQEILTRFNSELEACQNKIQELEAKLKNS